MSASVAVRMAVVMACILPGPIVQFCVNVNFDVLHFPHALVFLIAELFL